MVLSLAGMMFAATGHLSPVAGAISQEIIDVLAVLNALRAGTQAASVVSRWSGIVLQQGHPLDKIRGTFRPMFGDKHRHPIFL
jgi:hypothetical protein